MINTPSGFQIGVNLGGWLSQYQRYDEAHFASFITEQDLERIASWGFDHVRLPVDYPVLLDDERPDAYKESGFGHIDMCLEGCRKYGLNLVLDLHRAPGYSFNALAESNLFDNPAAQERFLRLWETIARRYASVEKPGLILELLNEVVLPSPTPWNDLAARAVRSIRKIDTNHHIMVGGNYYNAITALKDIALIDDERILYTFHFYEPMPFTHQKAYWVKWLHAFNRTFDYPSQVTGLGEFLKQHPEYKNDHYAASYVDMQMDEHYLESLFQDAVDFLKKTGKALYCGEFGAIELAPIESSIRWNRDFIALLEDHTIGRAYWSYKAMDFGLVDANGRLVSEALLHAVTGH
jgi:aryl-phospho-beta-D-glucosidase BglC (GH1 family)